MHPLDQFHYCPKCGSADFNIIAPIAKKCDSCGFEHYKNPSPAAAAIVFDSQDRLLCVRRAKEPAKGTLAIPGGFVDLDETIEQAAIREVKEETGIDIELTGFLGNIPNSYIYSGIEQYPLDFYFSAIIKDDSQQIAQKSEVSEILFIPRAQININDFGLYSNREALKKILK